MNRKIYIAMIVVFAIAISSCSISNNKKEVLSTDIEKLLSQEVHKLRIKQLRGSYYPAAENFTSRMLAKLKDYYVEEGQTAEKMSFDVVLSFNGFQEICLNTRDGYFWFDHSKQVYKIKDWNSNFWERYVLKEIDGQITYQSFEKDVLSRSYLGLYKKPEADEVLLYYDGDIRLSVKDNSVTVLPNVPEEWIESLIASNRIVNHLYIKENSDIGRSLLMVGSTYAHTNKYGSTSWLSCYEYDGKEIKKIWDANSLLRSTIKVKDYAKEVLTFEVKEQDIEIKLELTDEENQKINEYKKHLEEMGQQYIGKEDYVFFAIISEYRFFDYDKDGDEELIANVYMRGGAAGITEIIYFVYDFTEEGIELKDVSPARENPEINEIMSNI